MTAKKLSDAAAAAANNVSSSFELIDDAIYHFDSANGNEGTWSVCPAPKFRRMVSRELSSIAGDVALTDSLIKLAVNIISSRFGEEVESFRGGVPFSNGLGIVSEDRLALVPMSKDLHVTWHMEWDYISPGSRPMRWQHAVDWFDQDEGWLLRLEALIGMLIVGDSQQMIPVLGYAPGVGKGMIMRLIERLIGSRFVIAASSVAQMGDKYFTGDMRGKRLLSIPCLLYTSPSPRDS